MGISLQQYRAAIGKWQVGRTITTSEQSLPPKTSQADICTTICKEGIYQKGQLLGMWKLHSALLCALAIALALMISQSPYNSSVTDTNLKSCHISSTVTTNLDSIATTGNLIFSQCQKALLVRAGVETNPGPVAGIDTIDEYIKKQEDIIAELCSDAPNVEVRDCLRLYKPKNNGKQHKTQFAKCKKEVIVETLEFLSETGQDQFNRTTCINNLICRIQNLLPDICNLCKSEYCVKRDEISLLSCEICGQGSQNPCIWDDCNVDSDGREAFDAKQAMEKLNPTGFPGLHYLCGACETTIIPNKEAGLLKRKSTAAADTANSQQQQPQQSEIIAEEETTVEIEDTAIIEQLPQDDRESPSPVLPASEEVNQDRIPSQIQSQPESQPQLQSTTAKIICSFYRQGTCRFGNQGRGCPNEHPRPCKKLIQHGHKGPNGCILGKAKCDKFHPKMCHTSLTRGVCYETNCQLRHVMGTKREPSVINDVGHRSNKTDTRNTTFKKSENKTSDSEDFLGVLHRLKVDMLEAMDTKIAQYISAQTPPSTIGSYTRTAIPRMNMAETASYVNTGLQGPLHPMSMQTTQPWGMGIPGQPVYLQQGLNPVAPMYMQLRPGSLCH